MQPQTAPEEDVEYRAAVEAVMKAGYPDCAAISKATGVQGIPPAKALIARMQKDGFVSTPKRKGEEPRVLVNAREFARYFEIPPELDGETRELLEFIDLTLYEREEISINGIITEFKDLGISREVAEEALGELARLNKIGEIDGRGTAIVFPQRETATGDGTQPQVARLPRPRPTRPAPPSIRGSIGVRPPTLRGDDVSPPPTLVPNAAKPAPVSEPLKCAWPGCTETKFMSVTRKLCSRHNQRLLGLWRRNGGGQGTNVPMPSITEAVADYEARSKGTSTVHPIPLPAPPSTSLTLEKYVDDSASPSVAPTDEYSWQTQVAELQRRISELEAANQELEASVRHLEECLARLKTERQGLAETLVSNPFLQNLITLR
ncbi:MAG: hypothetical protein AAB367_04140 [Patescibacteria group bacterium]